MKILLVLLPCLLMGVPPQRDSPSQAPFVSGDSFRCFADFALDCHSSIEAEAVFRGSVVFVQGDFLKRFFEEVHPLIQNRYILLTHNSDEPSPGEFSPFLDDEKILAWFGENYDGTKHPKIHPIPMGIVSACRPNGKIEIIEAVRGQKLPKIHLAHMNFSVGNYIKERWDVFLYFSKASYCFRSALKPFDKYLADVASAYFEISPRGFAVDTFRVWESLYVGTIPIVKHSSLDDLYSGLPILFIDDWRELTEEFLRRKIDEFNIQSFEGMDKLCLDYWIALINKIRNQL